MKVTGLIRKERGAKTNCEIYDLQIDAVLNPSNTYIVQIDTDRMIQRNPRERYYTFTYRNIMSIIYGTVNKNDLCFNVQVVVYSDGQAIINQIILAECLNNSNYVFDFDEDFPIDGKYPAYILNMNDIQTLPEYSGKTVIECIEHFVDSLNLRGEFSNRFEFFKPVSKNKLMDFQEFSDYTDCQF
ncbi:hypothetical protein M1P97_19780 [Parabacteroides sp. GYB001]|uniref:hypothetical protein n=1 Tax=Parabacteroides leei TaxID=2939491 RepID=UPI002016B117|nr:hypothetical protein [Parabacteroides leei]MCL3853526.1 hypothetical protein [Parabacteroides leei]